MPPMHKKTYSRLSDADTDADAEDGAFNFQDESDDQEMAASASKRPKTSTRAMFPVIGALFVGLVMGILIGGAIRANSLVCSTSTVDSGGDDESVIPFLSLSTEETQDVRHYPEFEAAPPTDDGPEPIWDSLIPNGLGYVTYPESNPNKSVVGVFHQLHCLYLIRRVYYSTVNKTAEEIVENEGKNDFEFGIKRQPHVGHCFDYIRQSLMCNADSHIEPATEKINGNPDWGFERRCRSYEELKSWAQKWRAFDMEGSFVPHGEEDEDGDEDEAHKRFV